MNQPIDLASVLDDTRLNSFHWRVVALGALMMMLDGYDLSMLGLALPAVASAWQQDPSAFRWALSASLIGVGLGSLVAGILGDRVGRRVTLVAMFLLGSLACLGTAFATSIPHLIAWRFVVGIGMGGAIPNIIALVSEMMPVRRRALMVVLAYSGAALGGGFGSLLAAQIIPAFGWQSVFVVGGVLPLLVAIVVWFALPESPAFLIAKGQLHPHAAATVMRLNPDFPKQDADRLVLIEPAIGEKKGIRALFSQGRAVATCLLWILFICTQGMVFFMASWFSTLLTRADFSLEIALNTASFMDFGAFIGGIVAASLASRYPLERVLTVTYLITAVCIFGLGYVTHSHALTMAVTFAMGFALIGSSFCLGALAASYYPTEARSTGVGWGLGIGRVGSITSPVLGGAALAAGWTNPELFGASALPALVACVAVFLLGIYGRKLSVGAAAIKQ